MSKIEWFTGNIDVALKQYQDIKGVLLVYVYHKDEENNENTKLFHQLWKEFDLEVFGDIPVVPVKFTNDSADAAQFAQFFPTPMIPACYVIGLDGLPLEVITMAEPLDVNKFNAFLKKGVEHYRGQLKEKGIRLRTVGDSTTDSSPASSKEEREVIEARVKYARERLEEKRKMDALKKEDELRQKELARRNEGKKLLETIENQKQREAREAAEARRREKEEDAAILKRLREQIRLDKEERAKKNNTGETEIKKAKEEILPEPVLNKPVDVDVCRIQCKFPNGSTLVNSYDSKSPLQKVVDSIKEDGRLSGNFLLVQTFPRRQLNDLTQTLIQLGLTPSSTLLVVPAEGNVPLQKGHNGALSLHADYFNLLFGFLYTPIMAIFRFITSLFDFRTTPSTNASVSNANEAGPTRPTTSHVNSSSNLSPDNENERKKSRDIRREGNIGRLRNENDDSDNEATWNGNSTQQL